MLPFGLHGGIGALGKESSERAVTHRLLSQWPVVVVRRVVVAAASNRVRPRASLLAPSLHGNRIRKAMRDVCRSTSQQGFSNSP